MQADRLFIAALACALALAAGCTSHRTSMAGAKTTADVKPSNWDAAFARWTREQKVYEKMETRLIVSATWESGAFKEAYSDEYARRYVLNDSAREDVRKREESDAKSYQSFFVCAYTNETRWNDLSKRDSMWRLRLYDDKGASVEPLVVTRVKDDDPIHHAFFPYFNPWTRGYIVKFPREGLSAESKTLKLQLTSPVAAAELAWETRDSERPAAAHAEAAVLPAAP